MTSRKRCVPRFYFVVSKTKVQSKKSGPPVIILHKTPPISTAGRNLITRYKMQLLRKKHSQKRNWIHLESLAT